MAFGGTVPIIRHQPAPSVTDAERYGRHSRGEHLDGLSCRSVQFRRRAGRAVQLSEKRETQLAAADPMAHISIGQVIKEDRANNAMQEIDQEKLIESVRACQALYVTAHIKYGDSRFKENAWKEIGKNIGQSAITCKKTWTNLRDSFRRALRKRRRIKSGRLAAKMKKWKFENEMAFLIPHLQERETSANLGKDTDDNNDDVDDEYNEGVDNKDKRDCDKDDNIENNDKDTETDADNIDQDDYNNSHLKKLRRKKAMNRKVGKQGTRNKGHEFESEPVVIEYLLGDKQNVPPCQQRDGESSGIDMFFSSVASTVKNFSPYYQNIAKSKIFNIITDLEMKQIVQGQQVPFELPSTSRRRSSYAPISTTVSTEMLESYHSGPYDGCSVQSVSPSTIACPSPLSSQNFANSVSMTFHDEVTIKKE